MRHFIVTAIAVATLSTGLAMPANAQPYRHFTQDGEGYDYVVDRERNGVILVRGTVESSGEAFALRVRGDRVDGTVGVSSVSFRLSPETVSQLIGEVPASVAPTTLASN